MMRCVSFVVVVSCWLFVVVVRSLCIVCCLLLVVFYVVSSGACFDDCLMFADCGVVVRCCLLYGACFCC